ncbi:MAG TPA: chemotaxis protein CheW [Polyangiaceae bacterium]|nr:chemotaxis protein CheW [Polyangiaceae bacterium]
MPDIVRAPGARVIRRGVERGPVREFLVFSLASELYGVELARIREILSPPPVTHVPRSPPEVVGVCSVRGLLVTVVDLRRKLRVEERPLGRRARILLALAQSGETIGLLVDEVKQVMRLGDGEIEPSANALGGDLSEHVLGIGRSQDMFLILLDLSAIVSS